MGLPTPDELRVSPLLAMLDDRQLHVVGAFLTPETYQSGRSIVREGDVGYVLFIIKSGEAEVSRGAEILRRLAPGDFFGEIAIVSEDGKRTATVTARNCNNSCQDITAGGLVGQNEGTIGTLPASTAAIRTCGWPAGWA